MVINSHAWSILDGQKYLVVIRGKLLSNRFFSDNLAITESKVGFPLSHLTS